MSKGTPSSDSCEKTKTIKWNWNKDAFINDQQTQYPGIRVESMFEGVGRLVYEVDSLIDAVIRWYAYSAHRFSDNRPIIMEKELDSHEYINELGSSIFVKVMWEIAGKAQVGSKDDVETLKSVLKERDYFLHTFYHEYHKKRLEPGWMDDRINQLKAALVLAYGLTSKYEEAVEQLVTGINKPKKPARKAEEKPAEDAEVSEDSEETEDAEGTEETEEADDEDADDSEEDEESYERPVRDYGYRREGDGRRNGGYNRNGGNRDRKPYGDRPRNNYHHDGDRPRNNYNRDGPRGDRPRNNYNRDGDRPRNNYHHDGDRPRNNYNRDGDRPHRDGDYHKPRYDGDRPRNNYHHDGDRPRNNYNRDGDRPRNNYNRDGPRGDRPRNNYHHDGDRPRNNYNRDGPRGDRPYGDRPRYGEQGGYKKKPYKPRDGGYRKDY